MRYALALVAAALVQTPLAGPDNTFTNTMFVAACVTAAFVLFAARLSEV